MEAFKQSLARGLWRALAIFLLIEIWLWDHVKLWLRALGLMLGLERFETWLAARIAPLPPPATLAVLAVPLLLALPLKIAALLMIASGDVFLGAAVLIGAKALVLGCTAFLFDHCRDKLLGLPWFARFYHWVLGLRAWVHAHMEPTLAQLHAFQREALAHAARLRKEARAALARHPQAERAVDILQQRLARGFWFTLALIFLIESWLWDHVKEWLIALAYRLGAADVEAFVIRSVARLSPQQTLALFAAPLLLVLPFKLLALAALTHGHLFAGLAIALAAKLVTLGVTSFLFDHCRKKLLQMPWFARFYALVLRVRAWAYGLVAPAREKLLALAAMIRARALALFGEGRARVLRKAALLRTLIHSRSSA